MKTIVLLPGNKLPEDFSDTVYLVGIGSNPDSVFKEIFTSDGKASGVTGIKIDKENNIIRFSNDYKYVILEYKPSKEIPEKRFLISFDYENEVTSEYFLEIDIFKYMKHYFDKYVFQPGMTINMEKENKISVEHKSEFLYEVIQWLRYPHGPFRIEFDVQRRDDEITIWCPTKVILDDFLKNNNI